MRPTPKPPWNLQHLNVKAFAQAGETLQGEDAMARFERLGAESRPGLAHEADVVRWSVRGEMRMAAGGVEPSAWLHLSATGRIDLTCQRCLGPVQTPLVVDRWFRFVADEATAEAQDNDCEEDLLPLEPRPNLIDLIEDELLMALPLVPMHETCPEAVPMGSGDVDAGGSAQTERKNPFAVLAALKK